MPRSAMAEMGEARRCPRPLPDIDKLLGRAYRVSVMTSVGLPWRGGPYSQAGRPGVIQE